MILQPVQCPKISSNEMFSVSSNFFLDKNNKMQMKLTIDATGPNRISICFSHANVKTKGQKNWKWKTFGETCGRGNNWQNENHKKLTNKRNLKIPSCIHIIRNRPRPWMGETRRAWHLSFLFRFLKSSFGHFHIAFFFSMRFLVKRENLICDECVPQKTSKLKRGYRCALGEYVKRIYVATTNKRMSPKSFAEPIIVVPREYFHIVLRHNDLLLRWHVPWNMLHALC